MPSPIQSWKLSNAICLRDKISSYDSCVTIYELENNRKYLVIPNQRSWREKTFLYARFEELRVVRRERQTEQIVLLAWLLFASKFTQKCIIPPMYVDLNLFSL